MVHYMVIIFLSLHRHVVMSQWTNKQILWIPWILSMFVLSIRPSKVSLRNECLSNVLIAGESNFDEMLN